MNLKIRKMISLAIVGAMLMISFAGCSPKAPATEAGGTTQTGQTPKKQFFTFAANPSSSAFYPYWVAVGKAVQDNYSEFQVTVSESQGAVDIVNRIRSGESILGNSVSTSDYENYNGLGTFEGSPNKEARTLWYYAVSPMIVSVSKDSGISEIDGLSGERYNYGGTGTTGALVAKNIFDLLGINVNSFEASQSDAADAYSSRQIRGTIKFGSIAADSYVMQLNAALPINILGFTDEQIEKITKEYPYLSEITIPAGVYEGVDYEVKTVAFYQGATSTTNLSQEDGYKIVKAVYELGKATIDAGFPMGANDDIMKMALTSPIPLHAGTVQYMMEIGIDVPQDLIPEEYVAN